MAGQYIHLPAAPQHLIGRVKKMAHFAELDKNNVVLRVLVVAPHWITDENGNESEAIGQAHLAQAHGGRWIQCSYNGRIRGEYPGPGWTYDPVADIFKAPPEPEPEAKTEEPA
jgi:hypothetical protein